MNGHASPTAAAVPDFVPRKPPLRVLPPSFAQWDALASHLPALLSQPNTLQSKITSLPLLDAADLTTTEHLRRAYVVLGFLVHGFVWSQPDAGAQTEAEVRVPPQLAQPYLDVCARLGMEGSETLAYAGLCSWNWGFVDGDKEDGKWDLDNLECLVSFTGTRDEAAFYLVPVMVEREARELVPKLAGLVGRIQVGREGNHDAKLATEVENALVELKAALIKMQALMPLLHAHCDPSVFYQQVRPYFPGGKGGPGWIFELADGSEVTRWCVGGSAAQSATFPFLDAVLGVKHEKLGGEESVFEEMRGYMPGEQRAFLTEMEGMEVSIGDLVSRIGDDHGGAALREAYNAVLEELAKWRSKHIGVVTTHIVNQARKEKKGKVDVEEVTEGLSVKDESDLQGTGGSALIPFLKGARLDTVAARV